MGSAGDARQTSGQRAAMISFLRPVAATASTKCHLWLQVYEYYGTDLRVKKLCFMTPHPVKGLNLSSMV